jgi:hypothetical protein
MEVEDGALGFVQAYLDGVLHAMFGRTSVRTLIAARAALKTCMPGDLAITLDNAGLSCVVKHTEWGRTSAGFPIRRVDLKACTLAADVTAQNCPALMEDAALYVTAVLERLVAEILEPAGSACRDAGAGAISESHVKAGIRRDGELRALSAAVLPSLSSPAIAMADGQGPPPAAAGAVAGTAAGTAAGAATDSGVRILTFNIWFSDHQLENRMEAIAGLV